jgi:hypothetical protein
MNIQHTTTKSGMSNQNCVSRAIDNLQVRAWLRLTVAACAISAPGFIPSLSAQTVVFPDQDLEAAMRAEFNQYSGSITAADMESLTVLDLNARKRGGANSTAPIIRNLTGLETAANLTELNLSGSWISGFSPYILTFRR